MRRRVAYSLENVKEWHIVSELIAAGFDDGHTAFLARAILARLQNKLSLPGLDLAVISREKGNEVTLQQVTNLDDEADERGQVSTDEIEHYSQQSR